ncbi:MAG: Flagellar basal body rod protein FlgB [Alphaproteobacteria bacterium ADurb.BinA280]|jgi:flagellar basal-body rod protein FlgB|nr:flagellar basal body rod protein FlgB [Xanthomonadales bacterium]MCC6504618.1 flagellar basal body rod protein FlgB [Aquimonas sp.]OPZ12911.1 MAG: Flagellar basal body rod protein FlgB [Alphaproteobacteria bacterium ADurb.BinA280]
MNDPNSSVFGIHGAALSLRQERLKVLASNIANADTPNYKARDIDFAAALKRATEAQTPSETLSPAQAGASITEPSGEPFGLMYRLPLQPSLDGNTVDAEYEHASFARAAVEYRASLNFVDGRVRKLMTAITGS